MTWPEAPKITELLGLVDDGAVGWTGSYVHYIQQKPKKKRKSKVTQRREEDTLSSDKPYKLKEKINDMVSMPLEGPTTTTTTTTQDRMLPGTTANDVPMEQG